MRWLVSDKASLQIEAESLSRSLYAYLQAAWHVVEPATDFVPGWHIEAICEHLEAIPDQIRNLIINIPPRHAKSLTVSVFWPTWVWTHDPASRWLFSSYGESLALRDSLKCRRLIQSPWYQGRWGDIYQLTGDQNQKTRFENDHSGYRIATGVGGMATGEGGNFVVVDDPHKAGEADSDARREAANSWWDNTMSTRLNDPTRSARVIIMQRLHEDDLTGHVLEKMQDGGTEYVHLCLPAEYEPRVYAGPLGWADPRQEEGELLWPERFPREEIERLKAELGNDAAGQLQQRPAPEGGAIYHREWWDGQNRYNPTDGALINLAVGRYISVDGAFKDKDSADYTAIGVYELLPSYTLVKRWGWRGKVEFPDLIAEIEAVAREFNRDEKLRGVLIEDKASGTSAIQTLRQSADDWLSELIIAFEPTGSKPYRYRQASNWCQRGMVLLPTPHESNGWLYDFERELYQVPASKHDDQADEFTQMILFLEHYLADGWRANRRPM